MIINNDNFDMACQLADDIYFKFIDSLDSKKASEFVIPDKEQRIDPKKLISILIFSIINIQQRPSLNTK